MATSVTPNTGTAAPAANAAATATTGTVATAGQAQALLKQTMDTGYTLVTAPGGPGTMTLSAGINALAKIFDARQRHLADVSTAIANYTNATGTVPQGEMIRMQQESSANDILNSVMKSLFDKQQDSIKTWTRLQ